MIKTIYKLFIKQPVVLQIFDLLFIGYTIGLFIMLLIVGR